MDTKKLQAPEPSFIIEFNHKLNEGFQLHSAIGDQEHIEDTEPYTIYEVAGIARSAMDAFNEVFKTDYKVEKHLAISREALELNHDSDITVARMLKDLNKGTGELVEPTEYTHPVFYGNGLENGEIKTMPSPDTGEPTVYLSARGVLLAATIGWSDAPNAKVTGVMHKVCQAIAVKGGYGGATALYNRLQAMNTQEAADYMRGIYDNGGIGDDVILGIMENL